MPSASEFPPPAAVPVTEATWSALIAARARSGNDALTEILAASNSPGVISFSGGFPDPSSFPWETLATVLAELTAERDAGVLQYSPVQGVQLDSVVPAITT